MMIVTWHAYMTKWLASDTIGVGELPSGFFVV
jgi:hypothetical protein